MDDGWHVAAGLALWAMAYLLGWWKGWGKGWQDAEKAYKPHATHDFIRMQDTLGLGFKAPNLVWHRPIKLEDPDQ